MIYSISRFYICSFQEARGRWKSWWWSNRMGMASYHRSEKRGEICISYSTIREYSHWSPSTITIPGCDQLSPSTITTPGCSRWSHSTITTPGCGQWFTSTIDSNTCPVLGLDKIMEMVLHWQFRMSWWLLSHGWALLYWTFSIISVVNIRPFILILQLALFIFLHLSV